MADITSELEQLEARFLTRIKQFNGLSQIEKIKLAAETDFFSELQGLGLTRVVERLQLEYGAILKELIKIKQEGISPATYEDLQIIMDLDSESILRSAQAYSAQFKSRLLKGFIAGEDTKSIIDSLGEIGLKNNQLIAAVNTSRDEFHSTSLAKLYEDSPDTRYVLAGPVDMRTRCECLTVMMKQPKSGFTKQEIDKGAWHKLAMKDCAKYMERITGGKQNPYGFINRGGFNCRHRVEVVFE